MTASDLARCSNTSALAAGLVTHAEWPDCVAILPSSVMAYLRMDMGRLRGGARPNEAWARILTREQDNET